MTTAKYYSTTYNGQPVSYIAADRDCVTVEQIPGSVVNSSLYGVNGTFFELSTGNLLGIAINNGSIVKTGGGQTGQACGKLTKRGTFYYYSPPYGGIYMETPIVKDYTETGAPVNQIRWAIGGYSLLPSQSLTSSQYYAAINGTGDPSLCTSAKDNSENAYRLNAANPDVRTAIGYNGSSKVILAVFNAETAYGVRQFMINQGCTSLAIMLDGGTSSQMRARFQPTAGASFQDISIDPSNNHRPGLQYGSSESGQLAVKAILQRRE